MYYEGKKFACDACVRGHRVSGCTHSDRPLQEIAKKGRPVSQCQHCRTMRKSRSSHVKCDCGDKTKGIAKHHFINENGVLIDVEEREGSCQCHASGRCNCAIKKEQLDAVPEFPSPSTSGSTDSPRKPKLQSTQSDGCLIKFANGHHKPTHRLHSNHVSAPYHIPPHHHAHSGPIVPSQDYPIEGDFTLPEPLTRIPVVPSQIHPPLVLQELQSLRLVKSEDNSPDLTSSTYSSASERILPSALSRSVSDFNLPVGSRLPYELNLQTDVSRFATTDYNTPNEYFCSATGSDTGNQGSASFFAPNGWAFDTPLEPFYEFPPGLTQSVSGDEDSAVGETLQYTRIPSPPILNKNPLDHLQSPPSLDSSDLYESDEHRGLSAQSSMVGLSQLAIHPSGDLGPLGNYASVSNLDLTSMNNGYNEGTLLEQPINAYGDDKQFDLGQYTVSARNSTYLPDSEVFMMYHHNSSILPIPRANSDTE